MAKAKERVNKRNIFQLQERFQEFCTRCDFSVTIRSVDATGTVSRRCENRDQCTSMPMRSVRTIEGAPPARGAREK